MKNSTLRSVDLLAPVREGPFDWPIDSRRSDGFCEVSDAELLRMGKYSGEQVKSR